MTDLSTVSLEDLQAEMARRESSSLTCQTPAEFAAALEAKFLANGTLPRTYARDVEEGQPGYFYSFTADASGPRFTRIVMNTGSQRSVHCFVENATGHVYKAASWKTPAKGVRFTTMDAALAVANWSGGYLYR